MQDIDYSGRKLRFAEPVEVSAEYVFDGSGFTVTGSVKTVFLCECARCTKQFRDPFEASFEERFEKDADGESETYPFTGDELDMSDLIRDVLLLNMREYSVCSEDCRGLCPVCGCDLNTAQCSCAREEDIGPLGALAALLNENKEV